MKLEHLPDDLLEDYKVDKDNTKSKYKNREKKIKDGFAFYDLLTVEQRKRILNYMSE